MKVVEEYMDSSNMRICFELFAVDSSELQLPDDAKEFDLIANKEIYYEIEGRRHELNELQRFAGDLMFAFFLLRLMQLSAAFHSKHYDNYYHVDINGEHPVLSYAAKDGVELDLDDRSDHSIGAFLIAFGRTHFGGWAVQGCRDLDRSAQRSSKGCRESGVDCRIGWYDL